MFRCDQVRLQSGENALSGEPTSPVITQGHRRRGQGDCVDQRIHQVASFFHRALEARSAENNDSIARYGETIPGSHPPPLLEVPDPPLVGGKKDRRRGAQADLASEGTGSAQADTHADRGVLPLEYFRQFLHRLPQAGGGGDHQFASGGLGSQQNQARPDRGEGT